MEVPRPAAVHAPVPSGGFRDATDAWGLPDACSLDALDFDDAAAEEQTNGGGGALADFDGDGDLDLVVGSPFCEPAVLINEGDRFVAGQPGGLADLAYVAAYGLADLDYDRRPELLVAARGGLHAVEWIGGGFGRAELLWALPPDVRLESIAAADVDADGHVDLALGVGPIDGGPRIDGVPGNEDTFLFGSADGWEDRTDRFGAFADRGGATFALGWLDVDQDGDLDAYAVRDRGVETGGNALFLNPGTPDDPWLEVADAFGLALIADGMGLASGDVDGDGSLEIAVTDTMAQLQLYSVDDGAALEVGAARGLQVWDPEAQEVSWGVAFPDLDRDGDRDALVAFGSWEPGAPVGASVALWELRDGAYVPRPAALSIDADPEEESFRNALVGDVDGDGGLDLVVAPHLGRPRLLLGPPPAAGWLDVELKGSGYNPMALGAVVELRTSEGTQWRVLSPGSTGLHSAGPLRLHFGLGEADAEGITVRWPDGLTTVQSVPGVDRVVTIDR